MSATPSSTVWLSLGTALFSLALSGYTSYNANDKSLSNRLTAVETLQKADHEMREILNSRLDRIETKVDKVLTRLPDRQR